MWEVVDEDPSWSEYEKDPLTAPHKVAADIRAALELAGWRPARR